MTQVFLKDLWWQFLLLAVGSYLIGNINFAILISKAKKKDITKMGSGNPGTMNMSRNFGLGIGVMTLCLDIIKGVVPTLIGKLVFKGEQFATSGLSVSLMTEFIAGFCAVCGHIFPFWRKFKGGKGIATTIGVFLVAEPVITPIFLILALAFILITEMGSMGSFIATTPSAIVSVWHLYKDCFTVGANFSASIPVFVVTDLFIIMIIALTWIAHRANIVRLLSGEEHATNWMQMIKDLKYKSKLKKLKEKSSQNKAEE